MYKMVCGVKYFYVIVLTHLFANYPKIYCWPIRSEHAMCFNYQIVPEKINSYSTASDVLFTLIYAKTKA